MCLGGVCEGFGKWVDEVWLAEVSAGEWNECTCGIRGEEQICACVCAE